MGNFCLKIFFYRTCVQNDQRVMGIILRHVCWGIHLHPFGTPAADRPIHLPAPPPPPPPRLLDPQKFSHTVRCQYLNKPPPLLPH